MTTYTRLDPEQIGEAIRAFRAIHCPGCGIEKDLINEPFCDKCLGRLTTEVRENVCDKHHFLETFHQAMKQLKHESN